MTCFVCVFWCRRLLHVPLLVWTPKSRTTPVRYETEDLQPLFQIWEKVLTCQLLSFNPWVLFCRQFCLLAAHLSAVLPSVSPRSRVTDSVGHQTLINQSVSLSVGWKSETWNLCDHGADASRCALLSNGYRYPVTCSTASCLCHNIYLKLVWFCHTEEFPVGQFVVRESS